MELGALKKAHKVKRDGQQYELNKLIIIHGVQPVFCFVFLDTSSTSATQIISQGQSRLTLTLLC